MSILLIKYRTIFLRQKLIQPEQLRAHLGMKWNSFRLAPCCVANAFTYGFEVRASFPTRLIGSVIEKKEMSCNKSQSALEVYSCFRRSGSFHRAPAQSLLILNRFSRAFMFNSQIRHILSILTLFNSHHRFHRSQTIIYFVHNFFFIFFFYACNAMWISRLFLKLMVDVRSLMSRSVNTKHFFVFFFAIWNTSQKDKPTT